MDLGKLGRIADLAIQNAVAEHGCNTPFIIVPFDEGGKIVRSVLNITYGITEKALMDVSIIWRSVFLLLTLLWAGSVCAESASVSGQETISVLKDLNGKRIGVQTGTSFDEIVLEELPDAQISYFNSYPDMAAALEANKIDGFPGDEPVLRLMAAEDDKLTVLDERMGSFEFGFVLPKTDAGEELLAELNAWLTEIEASGELDEVIAKWTSGPEEDKTLPDYAGYPAPNGVLTMATEGGYAPMNYFRGGEVVGFEIDLTARFCKACGYGLKVVPMNFDGILPTVQAGKADFAAAGITITEERRESVNAQLLEDDGKAALD